MHSQKLENNFPGPGQYNINSTITIKEKGKSFGKEIRASHDSNRIFFHYLEIGVPGPGQYTVNTINVSIEAPKYGNMRYIETCLSTL